MSDSYPRYSMLIHWEPEDGTSMVTIPEWLGSQMHGRSHEEAVRQRQDAIECWIGATRGYAEAFLATVLSR